jgi:integrase/recombinase XerD
MSLGKQAKTLSKQQQDAVLAFLQTTRHAKRNNVIFLLSVRAGLRAKEIASLTWDMVCDASNAIADAIYLQDVASKGKSGGVIWMNKELKDALIEYRKSLKSAYQSGHVIQVHARAVSAQMVVNLFWNWYHRLGFTGCSSHSGRRTFITVAAKKISTVGGSIRDVQMLARHSSLQMTQRYIEADVDAQKRVVQLI